MRILLLLLFYGIALAKDANPTITSEMRAKFWRAQAEMIATQAQLDRTQVKLNAIRDELAKACGDWQLVAGNDGEPTCSEHKDAPTEKK